MSPIGSDPAPRFPFPLALVVTLGGVFAMMGGGAALVGRPGLGLRAQIAIGTLLLALPAALVLLVRPGLWPAVRGSREVTRRTLGLSALLGGALWLASAGLMEVQSLVAPPPEPYLDAFRAIHAALAPSGPLDALVSILVIAVLPGVCEELVVRGVFLPSLLRRGRPPQGGLAGGGATAGPGVGGWTAIAISAFLFAAIHLDPYRFLFTFLLGVVFGFLRLVTGSLWPSVVAHACLNTLTFAVAPFVDDPSQPYTPNALVGAACLAGGLVLATPLLRVLLASVDSNRERP